ncbi:MAG: hypothetical protein ACR2NZ_02495 [Rubripirellula sp.]
MAAIAIASLVVGCQKSAPIITYTVPTEVPEQLLPGNDRMLAVMVPKDGDVWFFKVSGPEKAVGSLESAFREFVQGITFDGSEPALKDLPEGWRRGGEKPMRFATLDVETPDKQLGISVSKLQRQEDWDEQVKMNVNRWRGQLGLGNSDEKWAAGEPFQVSAADDGAEAVWVDLVGESGNAAPMSPPFANRAPFASSKEQPSEASAPVAKADVKPDDRLKFERPEGWRDGRMSSMRMAAFNIGPEDSSAELTVIPAGGDLRGNVARWLGQVWGGAVPDEVVDQAMAEAEQVSVDGRDGQRFFLAGEEPGKGTAIDATIVPMDGGMSLFVKATGPSETVQQEADAIAAFLESLKLNL